MPKKIFWLLVVSCWFTLSGVEGLLVVVSPVLAQTDTPTPIGIPTCDLCGWCNRNSDPTPAPPSDWQKCNLCLYESSGQSKSGYYYTIFGCLSTKPEEFAKSMLTFVFSLSGGIAFLSVLLGSAIVLTSAGNTERLKTGKDIIVSAIFGLLLIIFSIFLLRVVGVDILKIPWIG